MEIVGNKGESWQRPYSPCFVASEVSAIEQRHYHPWITRVWTTQNRGSLASDTVFVKLRVTDAIERPRYRNVGRVPRGKEATP